MVKTDIDVEPTNSVHVQLIAVFLFAPKERTPIKELHHNRQEYTSTDPGWDTDMGCNFILLL